MKTSRADHVYSRNNEYNRDARNKRTPEFKRDYQLYTTSLQRQNRYDWTKDVGCQCGARSNMIGHSTPRHPEVVYYGGLPKQVYAYTRARSYTNVGVGSVMYQQKKRVRKIYLPETENRGVGSSDLSSLIADRKTRYDRENYYYCRKRTSSKCVGGALGNVKQCTEKLSPITIYNNSNGTSPNEKQKEKTFSKDIGNNTIEKNVTNTTTQVENHVQSEQISIKGQKPVKDEEPMGTLKSAANCGKKYPCSPPLQKSSDSLEQHVHNLEDPSYIQSTGSSDPMENKLEKEYRKIFTSKNKEDKTSTEKPMHDLKSTSLLRRRFEALKRGIAKKEDSRKNYTPPSKESNPVVRNSETPIHRDISIESDPPSLEARSYSHTKIFSPPPSVYKHERRSKYPRKKSRNSKKEAAKLPLKENKANDADVKGMFQVWGEKFNFEDGRKVDPPGVSFETKAKGQEAKTKRSELKAEPDDKKEGKRFFFFKKKSKDKTKSPLEKKGVTTGRCEVKTCTVLNRHNEQHSDTYSQEETPKKVSIKSEEDDIIKKNWLKNFIQRTIESRKSLQIRWNNKTYTTSSSTVFELMDNMYRQADVVIRSHSETSTIASSYKSNHKHRVNFVQDIEAWMIPKLIPHRNVPYNFIHRNDCHDGLDRKWFIDKSKAFAQEIEMVLNSKNFVRYHRTVSSDYIRIDIPKGFFSEPSSDSDKFATSNSEEVYKIIEYESPESRSELRFKVKNNTGDYSYNNVKIEKKVSVRDKDTDTTAIETVIKKPPVHRDVVIQGSNVHIPKRCDVIGVGIITHRVNREIGRSILNSEDDLSEVESEQLIGSNIKQCQFAESYLREYYRHWMPLGIDLFPDRVSDFYVKLESQETLSSLHNQGDVTKSCPNISNDYSSNINPSSNSHGSCKDLYLDRTKIFNTFKSTTQSEPPLEPKRVLPKDSFEVLRKRMLYACGNRSKWNYPDDQPYSVPSIQDKAEQDAMNEINQTPDKNKSKCKRVSITRCGGPLDCCQPDSQKAIRPSGILQYSKKSLTPSDTKHATVNEDDNCEILPPPCFDHCNSVDNPKCSQSASAPAKSPKKKSTSPSKKNSPPENNSPSKKNSPPENNSPSKIDSPIKYISPSNSNTPCKKNSPCKDISKIKPINSFECPCPCSGQVKSPPIEPKSNPSSLTTKLPLKPSTKCPCSPKKLMKLPQIPKPCTCVSCKKRKKQELPNFPTSNNSKSPSSMHSPCSSCQGHSKNTGHPSSKFCPCVGCLGKSHSRSSNESHANHTQISPKSIPDMSNLPIPCINPPLLVPLEDFEDLEDFAKKNKEVPRVQGVHLKMKPAPLPPKCVSNCSETESERKRKENEICRGPSEEQILIRVKKSTPSTEEIRDGLNVRVEDADGTTLFERRDYKTDCGIITHKSSLLGEVYKVNTMATASAGNLSLKENQPCAKSISNMIEISFGLKVTQGDKIAEINLSGGNDDADKFETKCNDRQSQDVFIINNEAEATVDDPNDKNDINIKIVIKNFDTKAAKPNRQQNKDDFSTKISQKFNTVSTGYSDILGSHIGDIYSMHRTTIDLTDSNEENLQITEGITKESLPKEDETGDEISIDDNKSTDYQDNQSIQYSETYEVVNRSRQNIVVSNSSETVVSQCATNANIQLNDACSVLDKTKTNEGTLNTEISENIGSVSKISICENVQKSELVIKTSTNDKLNITQNNKDIFESKNSSIGGELKNTDNDTLEENISKSGELHNSENPALFGNNDKTYVTIQKSEIILASRTENNEMDTSLENKSEINKASENIKNSAFLQNKSSILMNKLNNTNTIDNSLIREIIEKKSETGELLQDSRNHTIRRPSETIQPEIKSITKSNTYINTPVTQMGENELQHNVILKCGGGEDILNTGADNNILMSETMQSNESGRSITTDERTNNFKGLKTQMSECYKTDLEIEQLENQENCVPNEIMDNTTVNKVHYDTQLPTIEDEINTDFESENEHTDLNQSQDESAADQDNITEIFNTSDDNNVIITRPNTRREKKEMLKEVFEKATNQKWKNKSRMKRLKNMLKFILTSDSSEGEEVLVTRKELLKDITYSGLDPLVKDTDSMNNLYTMENLLQSDNESKIPRCCAKKEQSDCSVTSEHDVNINKCFCNIMAERLRKNGEIITGGCCCKSPKVHEQTSCHINNENDLYMVNYKAAEYIDVQTQNSAMNSRITNVMLVKKMESVMTSMKCSDFEKLKENKSVLPFRDDKECEVKNIKTNTVLGIIDDGKIVFRTSDSKKSSMQTEIIIGWKGKERKRHKENKKTYFSSPADILQSYETKKAVLEIYTERTVTKEGERLVAKLPKFDYDKEHEIEQKYVKNIL